MTLTVFVEQVAATGLGFVLATVALVSAGSAVRRRMVSNARKRAKARRR